MSINLYLKDGVEKTDRVEVQTLVAGNGEKYKSYSLQGIHLSRDGGRWYIYLRHLSDQIPPALRNFVDEISFQEVIPLQPKRITGVYKHEDATAELDVLHQGTENEKYLLKILGKNMEHMLELYRKIRAGTIAPTESWDKPQKLSQAPKKSWWHRIIG